MMSLLISSYTDLPVFLFFTPVTFRLCTAETADPGLLICPVDQPGKLAAVFCVLISVPGNSFQDFFLLFFGKAAVLQDFQSQLFSAFSWEIPSVYWRYLPIS